MVSEMRHLLFLTFGASISAFLASCSSSVPEVLISSRAISAVLSEGRDCIRGGDIIDERDVTLLSFTPKNPRACIKKLLIVNAAAKDFHIQGNLSDIRRGQFYTFVIEHDGQ